MFTYIFAVLGDISGSAGAPPGPIGAMLQNFLNYTLWLGVILSAIGAIIGFQRSSVSLPLGSFKSSK